MLKYSQKLLWLLFKMSKARKSNKISMISCGVTENTDFFGLKYCNLVFAF
jgi:hypothetical protein